MGKAAYLLSLLALCGSLVRAEGPPVEVPAGLRHSIESVARILARSGRKQEIKELLDDARSFGADAEEIGRTWKVCDSILRRVKEPAQQVPAAAEELHRVARSLSRLLDGLPDAQKKALARRILALDSSCKAAHEAAGDACEKGCWVPAFLSGFRQRRKAVEDAFHKAAHLEWKIDVAPGKNPSLVRIFGKGGTKVSAAGVSLESVKFSKERLSRMLLQTLRGLALTQWLQTGKLEVPRLRFPFDSVLLGSNAAYDKWVDEASRNGGLAPKDVAFTRKVGSTSDLRGYKVYGQVSEAQTEVWMVLDVFVQAYDDAYDTDTQPAVQVGLINWIGIEFLGCPLSGLAWVEHHSTQQETITGAGPATIREKELHRLSRAGMAGRRSFLRELVRRHEDPAWPTCMRAHAGQIIGPARIKATFVVKYLAEAGLLQNVLRNFHDTKGGIPLRTKQFEKSAGVSEAAFESHWRAWMLQPAEGLAQRLAAPKSPVSPEQKKVASVLDRIRRAAFPAGRNDYSYQPGFDPDLSRGARLHALYLSRNRKQLALWPGAHEEYPDREGFSAEGSEAGLHSVIASGLKGPKEAIDEWMGTFYHRLPLLDTGLVRIGWGFEKGIAVLDADSMVGPPPYLDIICWPPSDANDVPTDFQPELPNPLPGKDQSQCGYPITVQCFGFVPTHDPEMRLQEGVGGGNAQDVDCFVVTPDRPYNKELAPAGAYALIPKRHLDSHKVYTVSMRSPHDGSPMSWTFRTGD